MDGLDDVVRDYLAECREHLAGIENDLLAMEGQGADIDEELVNKVFRAAHSIKGGAGFFDLNRIRDLAHKIENVLDLIRCGQAQVTSAVVNVLLSSFDKLRELIDDPAGSERVDISEFVHRLEQLAASHIAGSSVDALRSKTPARVTRLSFTGFEQDINRKLHKFLYALEYDLIHDVQRKDKKPLEVVKELMRYGAILDIAFDLDSAGTLEASPSNRLSMELLYATALGPDLIGSVVDLPPERMWMTRPDGLCEPVPAAAPWGEPAPAATTAGNAADRPDEDGEAGTAALPGSAVQIAESNNPRAEPKKESNTEAAADATVRLNVTLLDQLMNLAGELVLGRNQLNDAVARHDAAMIQAASQRMSVITSEVQDTVMRTRMQPVGNLFQKFPRLVRDTAQKVGKEVRLVEEGGEVDLDKTIIEGLSDPLTHMVRNAIDHGIEKAEQRAAARKTPSGTVYLRAWHEAGLVVIEVADDGRGLNAGEIGEAAVAKGLIPAARVASMSDDEKLGLIFLPGLSTAKRVSDLSGRGVGLDVVKTNLNRLGGTIEIESQPGKGTSFRIKLPITLAIMPSLLVSSGVERVAIPLANVQELVRVPPAEIPKRIERVGSASVLMLRDGVLPLIRLDEVLDTADGDRDRAHAAMNVVVLSGGAFRYGLVVEELHGTVEIVVKPLGRHLRHLGEYAGATILGDGCVALILDVAGLATVAGLTAREGRVRTQAELEPPAEEETQHLLLFRNSAAENCAVPLTAVSRVMKIRPEDVETIGGRRTMQQLGRTLPLVMLSDVAKVVDTTVDQNAIVVVMESAGRQFGLVGLRPVDVLETGLDIDPHTLRQPGIIGSAVLRNRTTLVLDASELARAAFPGWEEAARLKRLEGATVLVAEDSGFFREHVTSILETEGATAIAAADGEIAWNLLEQRAAEVSLVITDVEMPRLNGFELIRRIRATPRMAAVPVIVLTSLAGEEDVKRGLAAGANAYCIKLDRDQLLALAAKLVGAPAIPSEAGGRSELEQLALRLRAENDNSAEAAGVEQGIR